jgi:hypothetical protein
MGMNGVGGGGSVSGGKGNSSVGAKSNASCKTTVTNDKSTKTTTAVKSCGISGFHGTKGIDTTKYAADKLSKTLDAKNKKTSAADIRPATTGKNYKVRDDVKVTSKVEAKMAELGKKVFDKLGHNVTFSSGYRGPKEQADAMYKKIQAGSDLSDYKQKALAKEIKNAYQANKTDSKKAIAAMTKVIEKQVADGKYVSSHLRSNAVDISSVDRKYYGDISKLVKEMDGTSIFEKKPVHLHIQF